MRSLFLFTIFLMHFVGMQAQVSMLRGRVTNIDNLGLEFVNVALKNTGTGTVSGEGGSYQLEIPANRNVEVVFSSMGFETVTKKVNLKLGQVLVINVVLESSNTAIDQVLIEDKQARTTTLTRLDPVLVSKLPSATGSFEAIIKTLPGVSSNNELSSQYTVRGGNFDENLVYVNQVEIYRPFLVRSGQQEGMSFINSDMVSSVLFSAGGFASAYGDKMSSVLDIKYEKPKEWGGAISGSLLGGSAMIKGASKSQKFSHISGFRYQTTKYLLKGLETQGDYNPQFMDFQTHLNYDFNNKFNLSFLGNFTQNTYQFVPQDRRTKFGTLAQAYELAMYFEGQELDEFLNYTGALTLNYQPNEKLNLKLIASGFSSRERETYDILSQYFINEVDEQLGSESLGDSIANVGVGSNLEHARNYLLASVVGVNHVGSYTHKKHKLTWSLGARHEQIEDNLTEWVYIDSAGYATPYTDSIVSVNNYVRAENALASTRFNAHFQDTYNTIWDIGSFSTTAGLRASYWDFNQEFLLSPRVNFSFAPDWKADFLFRFATGYYFQPAFYKEMRNPQGEINNNIEAQKSIHFVLGADYNFIAWNRPFKVVGELYYKNLRNLISYKVDNVRLIYSGVNDADGYAYGFDVKVNGEFVKGVDSWLSLSLMKTEEDIWNDGHGHVPRPSDQRFKLGVFFQDYFPGNPSYKMQLTMYYASGLPFGAPDSPRYTHTARMSPYQRVDIGFSKVLKSAARNYPRGHALYFLKDAWLSFEVFNLLNRDNTISHEWVTDYQGNQYAVENSLTSRRVNVKLSLKF